MKNKNKNMNNFITPLLETFLKAKLVEEALAKEIINFVTDTNIKYTESLKEEEKNRAKEILNKLLEVHAAFRRGEDVSKTLEEIRKEFKECIESLIKEKTTDGFKKAMESPFAIELFDKYTDYGYQVPKEGTKITEFKSLKELKDSNIVYNYDKCTFQVKMKESEKSIGKFLFFKQWWKTMSKESIPMEKFILSTSLGIDLYLSKEEILESSFYIKNSKELISNLTESVKFLQSGDVGNNTVMPSWMKKIDSGDISILENNNLEKTIEFMGDKIKGVFIAKRSSEESDFWSLSKKT